MSIRLLPALAPLALAIAPLLCYADTPDRPDTQRSDAQRRTSQPFLGIMPAQAPGQGDTRGVVVRTVAPNSPAERAGIQPGDQIVRVGDQNVDSFRALLETLRNHKPGEKLSFGVLRNGQEQRLSVTLGERPMRAMGQGQEGMEGGQEGMQRGQGEERSGEEPAEGRAQGDRDRQGSPAFLGVQLMQQGPGASNTEGAVIGRVVPGTPAEKAGLRSGDVITRIDDRPVRDAGQVTEAVRRAGVGKEIALTVQRGDSSKTYHVRLEAAPRGEEFGGQPPMMGGGPGMQPGMGGGMMRPGMPQMERRIEQLEQRVRELEQKLNRDRPEK